jgi:hypothetical protein
MNTVTVDQRSGGGSWQELGHWRFAADGSDEVAVTTTGTTGWIIADAIRFEAPLDPMLDSHRRVTLRVEQATALIATEVHGRQAGELRYHASGEDHLIDGLVPILDLAIELAPVVPPQGLAWEISRRSWR